MKNKIDASAVINVIFIGILAIIVIFIGVNITGRIINNNKVIENTEDVQDENKDISQELSTISGYYYVKNGEVYYEPSAVFVEYYGTDKFNNAFAISEDAGIYEFYLTNIETIATVYIDEQNMDEVIFFIDSDSNLNILNFNGSDIIYEQNIYTNIETIQTLEEYSLITDLDGNQYTYSFVNNAS